MIQAGSSLAPGDVVAPYDRGERKTVADQNYQETLDGPAGT